jgi:hypothetical protein
MWRQAFNRNSRTGEYEREHTLETLAHTIRRQCLDSSPAPPVAGTRVPRLTLSPRYRAT